MENKAHDPYAWIDRQIQYWQQKSREASEAADIDALPRRARTRQLSSYAPNKILARQKGRLKFRRPLFLIRFLLKILQQPQPFRVRHIRIAAQRRAGFPSLRRCQRRFRNIRDRLLRQPIRLAQGFQIIGRVPKLKIFNHTNPPIVDFFGRVPMLRLLL